MCGGDLGGSCRDLPEAGTSLQNSRKVPTPRTSAPHVPDSRPVSPPTAFPPPQSCPLSCLALGCPPACSPHSSLETGLTARLTASPHCCQPRFPAALVCLQHQQVCKPQAQPVFHLLLISKCQPDTAVVSPCAVLSPAPLPLPTPTPPRPTQSLPALTYS